MKWNRSLIASLNATQSNLLRRSFGVGENFIICPTSIQGSYSRHRYINENMVISKIFHGTLYILLWVIWLNSVSQAYPNNIQCAKLEDIFPSVQQFFLFWMLNRCNKTGLASPESGVSFLLATSYVKQLICYKFFKKTKHVKRKV